MIIWLVAEKCCHGSRIMPPRESPKFEGMTGGSGEYGWKASRGAESFISSRDFASEFVVAFLDLLERDRQGKIRRSERGHGANLTGGPWS